MTEDRLYHYTSALGLQGILETKSLWATDVFYLNDSREFKRGCKIADEYLGREAIQKATTPNARRRAIWLLEQIRAISPDRSIQTFVCSLSGDPDSLSQWRAYCREGGYAIGFPKQQLFDRAGELGFGLHPCLYGSEDQAIRMHTVIDEIARPWVFGGDDSSLEEDNERFSVSNRLLWELTRAAPTVKDPSFAEEAEWRLISTPERGYDQGIRFRERGGLLVPYTTLELPDGNEFWGRISIRVGPTHHMDEAMASVKGLARHHLGHVVAVEHTASSYREL